MQLHALHLTYAHGSCGPDYHRRSISSGPSWDLELRPWHSHFADCDWAGTGRATFHALERTCPATAVLSSRDFGSTRSYHFGKSERCGGEAWVANLRLTIVIVAIAIVPLRPPSF